MTSLTRLTQTFCILAMLTACSKVKSPETSGLFTPVTDPVSGVVSYALNYGDTRDNRQSLYFVTKSMTEDGRFLVFMYTEGNEKTGCGPRKLMLADLKTDKISEIIANCASGTFGIMQMTPFIEAKQNYLIYGDTEKGFFKVDFRKPQEHVKLCDIPEELKSIGKITRLATQLTLTMDRTKAFLDLEIQTDNGPKRYVQGLLDLNTGEWDEWGETEWNCHHGQLNPVDDSLALCAWECAWEEMGQNYMKETGWYPRMWLIRKGTKELIPARTRNFASHEIWDDDGKGFSWCGRGEMIDEDCVYHVDLETREEKPWAIVKGARHNNCSPDGKYVVVDQAPETWWRGCRWAVAFYNRETGKTAWVYTVREPLMPRDNQSALHPDPHPHFVMNGRYIVSTASNADGHMDLYVTPVGQLLEMTR